MSPRIWVSGAAHRLRAALVEDLPETSGRLPWDLEDVPIELDYRTEMILRKAYLLADDWKIEDPELIRQLTPN